MELMNLNKIAKETLLKFKDKGYVFTPKEYEKEFCKTAKKYNLIVEDCNKLSKYLSKLDKKYQLIAKNYNIRNLEEFIVFLINYLNRENSSWQKDSVNELFLYIKRVLDVLIVLPVLKSKEIAIKHLDVLKPYLNKEEFSKFRSEWVDFIDSFDDKIIKKAKNISGANKEDAIEIIKRLLDKLEENPKFDFLVDSIIYSLTPSYAPFMSDEVAILKRQLKEDSSFIFTKGFANDLKKLTDKRIQLDKEELKRKIKDLDNIAERLSIKILNILKKTDTSSNEIKNITKAIQNWRDDKKDFDTIKQKLLTIAKSIDFELKNFSVEIKKEDDEVKKLKERIHFLEERLKVLSKEVKTDFLTNIINKRGLEEELKKQESAFKRYNVNYSVVFFDIDHFKNVNDTYGHDAGDVILKSLGLLFRRYARDVDIIGRFGGEEFVAILPHTDKNGAYVFGEKIRKIVEKSKFMYKKIRIPITISSGVAERKEVNSQEELLKKADERLYLAKKSGRNKVCAEDKCE
jgi:diguanylate cyclase